MSGLLQLRADAFSVGLPSARSNHDRALCLRVAADCLAAARFCPSQADEARKYAGMVMADLPADLAAQIERALDCGSIRALDELANALAPPAAPTPSAFANRRGRPRNPHPALTNGSRPQAEMTVRDWTDPGRKPKCDIPISASHTEASMPTPQSDRPPSWSKLELEAIKPLRTVEELTSLDRDTLTRVYREFIVKLSPKRYGMKFKNVLKIMNGDAAT
jgi:hypothetical protein